MKYKKKGIIGISSFVHDSASCLIDNDGHIIFASAEERFSNIKSDSHIPFFTINKCIKIAKEKKIEIENLVIAHDPKLFFDSAFDNLVKDILKNEKKRKKFIEFLKKDTHQKFFNKLFNYKFIDNYFVKNKIFLSFKEKEKIYDLLTFYFNSFIKYKKVSLIIKQSFPKLKISFIRHHLAHAVSAYFNSGYKKSNILVIDGKGENDTITVFKADKNKISEITKTSWPISLGYFYQLVTFTLNYKIGDEFKVMGMSAYGKNTYLKYFEKCFMLNKNGEVEFKSNNYLKKRYYLNTKYELLYFTKIFLDKFGKIKEHEFKKKHFDLAKSAQTLIENLGLQIANFAKKKSNLSNLCISGGCALNGLMNNKILEKSKYKDVYVFSASGDDGTALGAAQSLILKNRYKPRKKIQHSFFGLEDKNLDKKKYIEKKLHRNLEISKEKNIYKFIASAIKNNKVVAIYNGKSEFGPRALGNRSIIANATNPNIKEDLNLKIKLREPYRPFAPIVLKQNYKEFFDLKKESYFMLFICKTFKNKRNVIPGVVHNDNTARVQIVNKSNQVFYKILLEYKKITNVPVMINTSFNIGGEAIVETIDDAIRSFNQMDIDYLMLGNFLIKKKYKLPAKDTKSFLETRKKFFKENNNHKRIELTRLNYNFYINKSKIIKEKAKDILKKTIKGGNFIS
jgi:carbamoyltransferase